VILSEMRFITIRNCENITVSNNYSLDRIRKNRILTGNKWNIVNKETEKMKRMMIKKERKENNK
jgi:hypothetical protein